LPPLPRANPFALNDPEKPQAPHAATALPAVEGFQVIRELGRGGMAVVYLARQYDLNRTVALKTMLLSGEFAGVRERERFQREAEATDRR
jgi:serine/threonine protein kinase